MSAWPRPRRAWSEICEPKRASCPVRLSLDVGCGPGAISVIVARLGAPNGRVIAVDREPSTVEAARRGREEAIVGHAAALVRPGGSVYLTGVEMTALRMRPRSRRRRPERPVPAWHANRGNDLSVGLRLGELLATAGLDVRRHEGRYQIAPALPGFRPPSWAAREALLAEGLASQADLDRWADDWRDSTRSSHAPRCSSPLHGLGAEGTLKATRKEARSRRGTDTHEVSEGAIAGACSDGGTAHRAKWPGTRRQPPAR